MVHALEAEPGRVRKGKVNGPEGQIDEPAQYCFVTQRK